MKPFNLQEALAGKPVVTRDGRPVKISGYNEGAEIPHQVVGWVDERARAWSAVGVCGLLGNSEYNLFMAPTEWKEWVVRTSLGIVYGAYETKEHAIQAAESMNNPTIHEITIVE